MTTRKRCVSHFFLFAHLFSTSIDANLLLGKFATAGHGVQNPTVDQQRACWCVVDTLLFHFSSYPLKSQYHPHRLPESRFSAFACTNLHVHQMEVVGERANPSLHSFVTAAAFAASTLGFNNSWKVRSVYGRVVCNQHSHIRLSLLARLARRAWRNRLQHAHSIRDYAAPMSNTSTASTNFFTDDPAMVSSYTALISPSLLAHRWIHISPFCSFTISGRAVLGHLPENEGNGELFLSPGEFVSLSHNIVSYAALGWFLSYAHLIKTRVSEKPGTGPEISLAAGTRVSACETGIGGRCTPRACARRRH